jgi:hypothetical protein
MVKKKNPKISTKKPKIGKQTADVRMAYALARKKAARCTAPAAREG